MEYLDGETSCIEAEALVNYTGGPAGTDNLTWALTLMGLNPGTRGLDGFLTGRRVCSGLGVQSVTSR